MPFLKYYRFYVNFLKYWGVNNHFSAQKKKKLYIMLTMSYSTLQSSFGIQCNDMSYEVGHKSNIMHG